MAHGVLDRESWGPLLLGWWFALVAFQWALLIIPIFLADSSGPGLAKNPDWLLYIVAGLAFFAAACDLGASWSGGCSRKLPLTVVGTMLNIADMCTDSLAAASVLAASWGEDNQLERAWGLVVKQSLLPCQVPLWLVAVAAWSSGGVQMMVAGFDLAISKSQPGLAEGADLLGFETVAMYSALQADEDSSDDDRKKAEDEANVRMVIKFLLRLMIENVFQLHLQLTCLGLSLALSGWDSACKNMLGSIALSFFFLLLKLGQTAFATLPNGALFGPGVVCIAGLPVGYAIAKFIALFTCPQSLLNITGCAVLEI